MFPALTWRWALLGATRLVFASKRPEDLALATGAEGGLMVRRRLRAPLPLRPPRGRRMYLARPGGRRDEEGDGLDVLLALDGGPLSQDKAT